MKDRHIRVFVSSVFTGMEDVRTYLMTKVFPKIIEEGKRHNVVVTPLDLRWGITEQASRKGETAKICLKEIERSQPYFIGILGNRYGWQPTVEELSVDPQTFKDYPWLREDVQNKLSMTEIEMQYGVLRNKEKINAFFYIGSDEMVEYSQRHFISEVRNNKRYPVSNFTTKEELGEKIERDFINLLNEKYPIIQNAPYILAKEAQEGVVNELILDYYPRQVIEKRIEDSIKDRSRNSLVLLGDRGCGISSLLAHFVNENKERLKIISVFPSLTNMTVEQIQHYLIESTCYMLGLDIPTPSKGTLYDQLDNLWSEVSGKNKESIIIIIDGIDSITDGIAQKQTSISWLPQARCGVKQLLSSSSVFYDENIALRGMDTLCIPDLLDSERIGAITKRLRRYSKDMSYEQIEVLASDSKSSNINVLMLALHEMIFNCVYETYKAYIDDYVKSKSVDEYYYSVVERMVGKFEFSTRILPFIIYSHIGLTEEDIIDLASITTMDWSQFYCAYNFIFKKRVGRIQIEDEKFKSIIKTFILEKEFKKRELDESSKVYLMDKILIMTRREIIELKERQLDELSKVYCPSKEEMTTFLQVYSGGLPSEDNLTKFIRNYCCSEHLYEGKEPLWRELVAQYYFCGYNDKLYRLLLNPIFTVYYERNYRTSLFFYWNYIQRVNSDYKFIGDVNLDNDNYTHPFLSDYFYSLAILADEGLATQEYALECIDKSISYLDNEISSIRDMKLVSRLNLKYSLTGDLTLISKLKTYDEDYYQEVVPALKLNEAQGYIDRGDYDKALKCANESLSLIEKLDKTNKILSYKAECYRIIADIHSYKYQLSHDSDIWNIAQRLYQDAFEIYEELYRLNPEEYLEEIVQLENNYALLLFDANLIDAAINIFDDIIDILENSSKDNKKRQMIYTKVLTSYGGILTDYAQTDPKKELYVKAKNILEKACVLLADLYEFDKQKYARMYSDALYNKARLLKRFNGCLGDVVLGLYNKCLNLYRECEEKSSEAQIYASMGVYFRDIGDFLEAIISFIKSLSIYSSIKSSGVIYHQKMINLIDEICRNYDQLNMRMEKRIYIKSKKDLLWELYIATQKLEYKNKYEEVKQLLSEY